MNRKPQVVEPLVPGHWDHLLAGLLLLAIGGLPLIIRFAPMDFVAPGFQAFFDYNTGFHGNVFSYYKTLFLFMLSLGCLLLLLRKALWGRTDLRCDGIAFLAGCFWGCLLISARQADFPCVAFRGMYAHQEGILTYLGYVALFFGAANLPVSPRFHRGICLALGFVAAVNAVLCCCHFWGINLLDYPGFRGFIVPREFWNLPKGFLTGTFSNPNFVGGFLGAALLFFLAVALFEEDRKRSFLAVFLTILLFLGLQCSGARSGLVAFFLPAPVIIGLAVKKRSWQVIRKPLVIVLCGGGLVLLPLLGKVFSGYRLLGGQTVSSGSQASSATRSTDEFGLPAPGLALGNGRLYIWRRTVALIWARPFFGYGPDTFTYHFPQDDPEKVAGMGTYSLTVDKVHNLFLQTAVNFGLFGLVSFFLLVFGTLRNLWRQIQQPDQDSMRQGHLISTAAFLIGFLLQGMFNDSIVETSPIFWALLGTAVSLADQSPVPLAR
jgi:O-antigen ligase